MDSFTHLQTLWNGNHASARATQSTYASHRMMAEIRRYVRNERPLQRAKMGPLRTITWYGGILFNGILLQGMPFSDAAQGIMSMALLDARNKEHECAFLDATGISERKGMGWGLDSLGLTFTFLS